MQSQVENQRSTQWVNLLVDFHVYIIQKRIWKNCQPLAENEVMKHVISAGFVYVAESLTLDELRQYIIDICDEENYIPKKNLSSKYNATPEIYIVEEYHNDDSSILKQRIDCLLRKSSISKSLISSQIWIKPMDGSSLIYSLFNHYQLPQNLTVPRTLS
ncbi:unnamed protein product [Rotaria sp. Silwood2]|nr:unnamed protein product [Rotaria sp. Silwood2]CAF3149357.1 unnamed protein product [Rotaria sp. Silwood2]CAF4453119.1 unnamed protein product [Rotaria sp. Silwood2]CAF4578853.1 unnamed protein product [Rotaria sp. Silwood2]